MSENSYADQSRLGWIPSPADRNPNVDELKLGCLQRIAMACEAMATEHQGLINRNKWLENETRQQNIEAIRLGKVIAGLRGEITKLKKRK